MHRDNWDDLRFVLAVATHGSVSAAARALKVNHATVLRRVAAFEERHGSPIFDKSPQGYSVSAERQRVIDALREVEEAVLGLNRAIEGTREPLHGVVRVTSTDTICQLVLPPILAELRQTAADLQIELIVSNAHLDLARLAADITVRPAAKLPPELAGTVACKLGFGVYAADGRPECWPECWLGLSGALGQSLPAEWMARNVPPERIVGGADSFLVLRELAAEGIGRVVLPVHVGDSDPRLVRLEVPGFDFSVDLWVASHADLADVPRLKAAREVLTRALAARAGWLAGTGPNPG